MSDRPQDGASENIDELILARLLRLNAAVQGTVTGILLGLVIFLATNWLILKALIFSEPTVPVGPHLALLGQYFIGYNVSFPGSIVGFGYAFAIGFIGGYLTSIIYNRLVERKERRISAES